MKTVYVNYTYDEHGGDLREGEEPGPYASREQAYRHNTFNVVTRDAPLGWPYESVEVHEDVYKLADVFVAIGLYTDGGTFGSTEGYVHVIGVYATVTEARAAMEAALADTTYGVPWNGYFSRFNSSQIECMRVVDGK